MWMNLENSTLHERGQSKDLMYDSKMRKIKGMKQFGLLS
jgi:hypothetical protein